MRIRIPLSTAAAFAVPVAIMMGLAAPALAAGGSAAPPGRADGQGAAASAVKSHQFAGYEVNEGGRTHFSVTAMFAVPNVSCGTATKERAIAPSVGMGTSSSYSQATLFVGCYNGKAHYWPSLELNGTLAKYSSGKADAHPGDTIVLTAQENKTNSYVAVVNQTRNITRSLNGAGSSSVGFPWIGDDAWVISGQRLGVPNFGTITFSQSFVNGTALGSLPGSSNVPAVFRFNRVSSTGVLQIQTGAISSSHTDFSTDFKHS